MSPARRALPWVPVAVVAAVLAAAGYWLLFTTFMLYDDEGYVLMSLKNFSAVGGLYDKVYTQYGPFPFFFYDLLHRILGFDFTNTTGRWITLIAWLGTAGACSAMVARFTRSALWTAFAFAGVFTYLWTMINEPIHPGGLLSLLVALGVWLGAEAWHSGNIRRFAMVTGLIGAALALTKINVGVFFLGAAFIWLAVNTASARVSHALTLLAALGCALLPAVLMHGLWDNYWNDTYWVHIFAVVFATGSLGALLAARSAARPVAGVPEWLRFAGAAAGAGAVLCALTLLRGTSVAGLLNGVVLEPLKHPGIYFFPMDWRIGSTAVGLGSLAFAALAARGSGWRRPAVRRGIVALRLVAAAFFIASPLRLIPTSLAAWGMCYGVSLAWAFAARIRDEDRLAGVRSWVALAFVFQCLHAYPVAGSQVNWGTYLFVPLLALGMHDTFLAALPLPRPWRLVSLLGGAAVIAGAVAMMTVQLEEIGRGRYFSTDEPLGIPGAENIRPPPETGYDIRVVEENIRAHAGMLFSYPGIYSTNLWSGVPTPTLSNATHWFSLLSETRQREIVASLDSNPRSVLVIQRDVADYLVRWGFRMAGPLYDWLMAQFEPAFKVDGYEFWIRRGRTIAPLSTARLLQADGKATLTLTLKTPASPVKAVEIRDLYGTHAALIRLDESNAKFVTESIDLTGAPAGNGNVTRLTIAFPSLPYGLSNRSTVVIVPMDAAGQTLGKVRLVE